MSDDIVPSDVNRAELWIHKNKDIFNSGNQTVVVSEEIFEADGRSFRKTMPVIEEIVLTGRDLLKSLKKLFGKAYPYAQLNVVDS